MNAPLQTPIGTIPRMTIGRASDIKARRQSDYEVSNIAVRTDDFDAFLGIVKTREEHLAAPMKPRRTHAIAAAEIAGFVLAAKEAIETDCPPELVEAHLKTACASAIALLVDVQGNG
ncbi:hypothetical protein [Qipengyuania flava]|uniref:hypothetical protein n=1 Tax=Qipengyuania flava TaxID=192812 RepID=UPI00273FFF90|nr:hypothetical protein [Qipengyuania flava]